MHFFSSKTNKKCSSRFYCHIKTGRNAFNRGGAIAFRKYYPLLIRKQKRTSEEMFLFISELITNSQAVVQLQEEEQVLPHLHCVRPQFQTRNLLQLHFFSSDPFISLDELLHRHHQEFSGFHRYELSLDLEITHIIFLKTCSNHMTRSRCGMSLNSFYLGCN